MAMRMGARLRMGWLALGLLLLTAAGLAQDPGQAVVKQFGLDADLPTNMRVELIGQRIALAAGLSDVRFAVFNDRELNAFALPDGRIYLTSLMAHAVSDDELAFVIGHEMTHIRDGHAKNQSEKATGGALLGAILVAVLGGSGGSIRMGADILGSLTLGHYSRKDERAADNGGLALMARAGFDPKQAPAAMQRLIDRYGAGDANVPVLGWFATHPDSRTRRERLQTGAETLAATPPERLAPPRGVEFTLDPRAGHAIPWAYNYFSLALAAESGGRAQVTPPLTGLPAAIPVALPVPEPAAEPSTDEKEKGKDKDKAKDAPLPPVTVQVPALPLDCRVRLLLEPVPAGRLEASAIPEGAAVRAILQWADTASGMSGTCTAVAQTRDAVPWQATEQLREHPDTLALLSDGKQDNLEGTLEAAALRRVVRAYAEILIAGGPVDHGAPVTLKLAAGKPRPADHVAVVRNGRFVAEVTVDAVNGKQVTGTVLWGTHKWKKNDKFILMAQ